MMNLAPSWRYRDSLSCGMPSWAEAVRCSSSLSKYQKAIVVVFSRPTRHKLLICNYLYYRRGTHKTLECKSLDIHTSIVKTTLRQCKKPKSGLYLYKINVFYQCRGIEISLIHKWNKRAKALYHRPPNVFHLKFKVFVC